MKIISSFILLTLSSGFLFGQNFEKVVFNDQLENGYYVSVMPQSEDIKGVLILMPGFGENAESIFPESKIQNVGYLNGILTVAIAGGRKLYADEEVTTRLNEAFEHVRKKYGVEKDQFVIGGFSAGGTISLRYAEYSYENPQEAAIQPQGVFSVDSPVDLFDIWDYFQREIKKNYSEAGVGEAKFVSEIMLNEIGDPVKDKDTYNRLTPFNADLDKPGNEKFLKEIAVRVYHDVDVVWQLQNRRRSLFDMNSLAASEMISRLMLMGNERAEFMPAKQPGVRSTGLRHPHSWSIVDEVELVQWVGTLIE